MLISLVYADRPDPAILADAFADLRRPIFDDHAADGGSIAHKLLEGFRQRNRG